MVRNPKISLMPLGTGKGATAVYDGEPSSSFCIQIDGINELLVDCGLGVVQQLKKYCGRVPKFVYISHNHTDHSGELPVVLIVELMNGTKLTVGGSSEVLRRLKEHRIHELYSTGKSANELANWRSIEPGELDMLSEYLSMELFKAKHSELSYGFVLHHNGNPIVGYTSDSGFDPDLYRDLSIAPIFIADGREKASSEHAGFDELKQWQTENSHTQLWVTGYGGIKDRTEESLNYLRIGEPLTLVQ